NKDIIAIVRDFEPAGRVLKVSKRRGANRAQRAVRRDAERGNRPQVSTAVVSVRNEKLVGAGGPKFASEGAAALGHEGRARRGGQRSISIDAEAVDLGVGIGCAYAHPCQPRTVRTEENVARLGRIRQRVGRAGDRLQAAVTFKGESRVIATTGAGVG